MTRKSNPPIEERWKLIASIAREDAESLPPGKDRDALLNKARQLETASHINEWLSSPGVASRSGAQSMAHNARRHQAE